MYYPQQSIDDSYTYYNNYGYSIDSSSYNYQEPYFFGNISNYNFDFSYNQYYLSYNSQYSNSSLYTSSNTSPIVTKKNSYHSSPISTNTSYYNNSCNSNYTQDSNYSGYEPQLSIDQNVTRKRQREDEFENEKAKKPKFESVEKFEDLLNGNKYCSECKYEFNTVADYIMHISVFHHGQCSKQCPLCKKSYATPNNTLTHVKHHTGERQHKCDHCQKCFYDLSSLQKHLNTHSTRKPYVCHICSKDFAQKVNLNRHINTKHINSSKTF